MHLYRGVASLFSVREAGGVTTEMKGGNALETGSIISSNADLHPQLEKRLRQAGANTPNVD